MEKIYLRLQMFAEGGDGAAGAAEGATGEQGTTPAAGENKGGQSKEALGKIRYGKQPQEEEESGDIAEETPVKSFDDLIKGEYKEEYDSRIQKIINKRFAETKQMEDRMNSVNPILEMLGNKYGVDAADAEKLRAAIEEDESFYEEEAAERGLTVAQLREIKKMERENADLKRAREEAERRQNADSIYQRWMQEAESTKEIYPNFDFRTETQNDEFNGLIKNGIDVKTAYEVIHKDEIISGAMQYTAAQTQKKVVNGIQARGRRASENGVAAHPGVVTKSNVNELTKKDREEIERRVMRGEKIIF